MRTEKISRLKVIKCQKGKKEKKNKFAYHTHVTDRKKNDIFSN